MAQYHPLISPCPYLPLSFNPPQVIAAIAWTGVVTTALTAYGENYAMRSLSAAESTVIYSTEVGDTTPCHMIPDHNSNDYPLLSAAESTVIYSTEVRTRDTTHAIYMIPDHNSNDYPLLSAAESTVIYSTEVGIFPFLISLALGGQTLTLTLTVTQS